MSSWKASLARKDQQEAGQDASWHGSEGSSSNAFSGQTNKRQDQQAKTPKTPKSSKRLTDVFNPMYLQSDDSDGEGGQRANRRYTFSEDGGSQQVGDEDRISRQKEATRLGGRWANSNGEDEGGPTSWVDVEDGLSAQAEELLDNITRSIQEAGRQRGTILEKLLAASAAEAKEFPDPLGQGVLDLASKAIAAPGTVQAQGSWGGARSLRPGQSTSKGGARVEDAAAAAVASTDAGAAAGDAGGHRPGLLPAELAAIMPDQEGFQPEAYLGTFHKDTRLAQLRKGVKHLDQELGERSSQLKQLIKENFERFTSCQSTIDDIYAKLQQVEGMGLGSNARLGKEAGSTKLKNKAAGSVGASTQAQQPVGGLEALQRALTALQSSGKSTWGDVLDQAAQADRIRSVSALLARFNNLFGMPGRIKALAAANSLDQVVSEYKRANALIRPTARSAKIWVTLHKEIEKRVLDAYSSNKTALLGPQLDAQAAPDRIIFMAQLAQQQLPGTRDEDAMRLFLDTAQQQLLEGVAACDAQLTRRLRQLRIQLERTPAMRAAAMDFAAAWKLQGPTAWNLEREDSVMTAGHESWSESSSVVAAALERMDSMRSSVTSPDQMLRSPSLRHRTPGTGASSPYARRHALDDDSGDDDADDSPEKAAAPRGKLGISARTSQPGAAASPDLARGSTSFASARVGTMPTAELPSVPSTLEDLALLMWPGPPDWRPELDLSPAMRADLQWRLQPSTPRSQLLPEPSFRLAPAQSAWAEYVSQLCAVLVSKLPELWAVVKSDKYAKATDVPSAVYDSMLRAPVLARKLVEIVITQYSARVQVALQALSQAGPLCPAVELVVKVLCRSWQALHQQSTTSRALDGVQAAALSAFNLYAMCLKAHLAVAPSMALEGECWAVDVSQSSQQPVTYLPQQLQEEVALAMFHCGVLSAQCERVDAAGARRAWQYLREGMFGCFAATASLIQSYTEALRQRLTNTPAHPTPQGSTQLGREHSLQDFSRQLSLGPLTSHHLDDMHLPMDPQAMLTLPSKSSIGPSASEGQLDMARQGAAASKPAVRGSPMKVAGSTSAFAAAAAQADGPLGLPSSLGPQAPHVPISRADEVRMLLLMSNAMWLRANVAPALAQTYQQRLAGEEEGDLAAYAQQLSWQLQELQSATHALVDVFLEHRQALARQHVSAYVSVVCAAGAATSNKVLSASGAPPAVSDACLALVTHLVFAYTLMISYCSFDVMSSVMPALLGHAAEQLSASCDELTPNAAGPFAVLQLYVDICYLQRAWQEMLPSEGIEALAAAAGQLKTLLKQALSSGSVDSSSATGPLASLILAAASGPRALSKELTTWAHQLVEHCIQRTQCNIACFAVGTIAPSTPSSASQRVQSTA